MCVADGLCIVVPEVSHIGVDGSPAGADLGLPRSGGTGKVDVVIFLFLLTANLLLVLLFTLEAVLRAATITEQRTAHRFMTAVHGCSKFYFIFLNS